MSVKIFRKIHTGKVVELTQAADNLFYIKIYAKNFEIVPGQFVSILCGDLTLRRPFSVMDIDKNTFTILFKTKGEGTRYISNLKSDDKINFTGPFGNGFNIENKKSLLIAAGVGIAPIYFLRKELQIRFIENKLIAGFLNKFCIPKNLDIDLITTDDGSFGKKGSVIDCISEEIIKFNPQKIYACGPLIVLKNICEKTLNLKIETEIAMEKEMACSIGVCRGCVIELKNGKNATVCKDGPIFKGDEIKWN